MLASIDLDADGEEIRTSAALQQRMFGATQEEIDKNEIAGMTKQLTAAAAAASVKSLGKGGPHSGGAMSASGDLQSTALSQASDMNKNVQGQSPSLAAPTPVGGAQ